MEDAEAAVESVRRGLDAAGAGEFDRVRELLHGGATLGVGGRGQLAGEHGGPDGVVGYFRRLAELSAGTWRIIGLDIGAAEEHVVAIYLAQASRGQQRLNSHEALAVELADGLWKNAFVYVFDQYAFDEFWS